MTMRPVVLTANATDARVFNCAPQEQVRIYHKDTGEIAENLNSGVSLFYYQLTLTKDRNWLVTTVRPRTADHCPKVMSAAS